MIERSTSWVKDGDKYETYKSKKNGVNRILVKKNGSPIEIIKQDKNKGTESVIKRKVII